MPRLLPGPFLPLPLRLPTSSHSQFHTSSPTAKKFKPQKPFLLPGQTPGQQRQERKRQEKITQAIKRGRLEQGYVSPGPSAIDRRGPILGSTPSIRRGEERGPSSRRSEAVEEDYRPFGLRATLSDSAERLKDLRQGGLAVTASSTRSDRLHIADLVNVKAGRAQEDGVDGWDSNTGKPEDLKIPFDEDAPSTKSSFAYRRSLPDLSVPDAEVDFLPDLPSPPGTSHAGSSSPDRKSSTTPTSRPVGAYAAVLNSRRSAGSTSSSSSASVGRSRGYHSSAILRSALGDGVDWRVPSEQEYAKYDRDKREARKRAYVQREGWKRRDDGDSRPGQVSVRRPWEERRTGSERPEGQVARPYYARKNEVDRPFHVKKDNITRPFRPARKHLSGPSSFPNTNIRSTTPTQPVEPPSDEPRPENRWAPTKRLSRPAMIGIKKLYAEDPVKYSRAVLSKSFGVSVEAIARILKSDGRWYKPEKENVGEEVDPSLSGR